MSEERFAADDLRLAESERRYQAVIENASDMIQSVRPDGTFEFVNRAWRTKLGYAEGEERDITVWKIIHPDSIPHCMQFFVKAVNGEAVDHVEAIFVTKRGDPVPVEGNVTPRTIGDRVVATHGFFRDVSERLRAQELERENARLEREQLARYLEKMAALGKLSAGLAHELNNPAAAAQRASARLAESLERRDALLRELTADGGAPSSVHAVSALIAELEASPRGAPTQDPLAESEREGEMERWLEAHGVERAWDVAPVLAQARLTTDRLERLASSVPASLLAAAIGWLGETIAIREMTAIISRSSHRISELVRAVKGYSHMDRATEHESDVHEGIESTLLILNHRLQETTVRREYDRTLPPVRVFGNTLNQVWTNILDNAADATQGAGTITIRTRRAGANAVVEIEDDGTGIAPEHLPRIFEPFFTTKPQGVGTGLGLDIAWRIVTEEHGGKIDVESQPGQTIFRVRLPLAGERP